MTVSMKKKLLFVGIGCIVALSLLGGILYQRKLSSTELLVRQLRKLDKKSRAMTDPQLLFQEGDLIYFKAIAMMGDYLPENVESVQTREQKASIAEREIRTLAEYFLKETKQDTEPLSSLFTKLTTTMLKRAKDLYLAGIALSENLDPEHIFRAGECYFRLGKSYYDSAEYCFRKALELGVANPKTYTFLGNLEYIKGNRDTARLYYDKALMREPDNIYILFNKALILAEGGDTIAAASILHRIIESYSTQESVSDEDYRVLLKGMYTLGEVYRQSGRFAESEKWFQNVLDQQPGNVIALYGLGRTYHQQGNDTEALRVFRDLASIAPGFRDVQRMIKQIGGSD